MRESFKKKFFVLEAISLYKTQYFLFPKFLSDFQKFFSNLKKTGGLSSFNACLALIPRETLSLTNKILKNVQLMR